MGAAAAGADASVRAAQRTGRTLGELQTSHPFCLFAALFLVAIPDRVPDVNVGPLCGRFAGAAPRHAEAARLRLHRQCSAPHGVSRGEQQQQPYKGGRWGVPVSTRTPTLPKVSKGRIWGRWLSVACERE